MVMRPQPLVLTADERLELLERDNTEMKWVLSILGFILFLALLGGRNR
jgi:hypothetical protein